MMGLRNWLFEEAGEGGWAGILETQVALKIQGILEIQGNLELCLQKKSIKSSSNMSFKSS